MRHLGMSMTEYLQVFDRVNLCGGPWHWDEARATAAALLRSDRKVLVLLGRKVSESFGVDVRAPAIAEVGGKKLLIAPHPSGRCRLWNEPGMEDEVQMMLWKLIRS